MDYKKPKYYGCWSANNGSTYDSSLTSNNLREFKKLLREIVAGNVFPGNSGNWSIHSTNADISDFPVAHGTIRKSGVVGMR